MRQAVDGLQLASNVILGSSPKKVLDCGVSLVNAAKDFGSLKLPGKQDDS